SCVFLCALFLLLCRKLVTDTSLPVDNDWLQRLSPLRYQPMERLLDADEYRRLKAHPAISRKSLHTIRTRRIRLFREYLRCLSLDYSRICTAIKIVMVQSAQDRPDLARLLVLQRFTFSARLLMAECRLTLHYLGICGVDAGKLVAAMEAMRLQLNSMLEAQ